MKSTIPSTTFVRCGRTAERPPPRSARIRAITVGIGPNGDDASALGGRLKSFYATATEAFASEGFEVHTRRLALCPVRASERSTRYSVLNRLATITRAADVAGVRWTCLPFVADTRAHTEDWRIAAVEVVRRFPHTFVNFMVAEQGVIYHDALGEVAQAVLDIASLSSNGFDNFRVGAGCNLVANTPFFPFSYHDGADGFALAVEIIEVLLCTLERCSSGASIDEKRAGICAALDEVVRAVDAVGRQIEESTGFHYKGLDISLAPFPDQRRSIAVLFRLLDLDMPGHPGTLAVTSFFTDILKAVIRNAQVRATGFNGVMFAPLEDTGLAAAVNARLVTIDKLLQWSTVCGCGIDMVPVSGNIMREELAALILDTAAVSSVLRKPLGVRVLPIPGAEANEMTNFNHDFLVNTRVLSLPGQSIPLGAAADGTFRYLRP